MFGSVGNARASHGGGCAGALDYSLCVEISDELHATTAAVDANTLRLDTIINLADGTNGGFFLDESVTDRLDAAWYGIWAFVGVAFALIAAPMIQSAFKRWSA